MSKLVGIRNLFFTDYSPQAPYTKVAERTKNNIHYGQCKLMFEEILFLTLFWDKRVIKHPQILIIGSSPGMHIPILVKMFPDATFHLYDPCEIRIPPASRERIVLYQQFFMNEDAEKWAGRDDVIIISDIRSITKDMPKKEYEDAVERDMAMQQEWVDIINPVTASLKFRLRYPLLNEVTGLYDIEHITEYLDGYRMKQVWGPQKTTEVRLIPFKVNGKYIKKKWSSLLHQNQCFFHNSFIRPSNFYNPFTQDMTPIFGEELTNDFDSVATTLILMAYLQRMTGEIPSSTDTLALYQVILQDINNHRPSILTIKQLRESEWKSSIRKDAEDRNWLVKTIPQFKYTYKAYIYIAIGDEPLIAPEPIEILR